ncbi:MAG: hypothetical protein KQJ78_11680 [Deltaproteobacteria bacterium]|nr:hypothetical protein [Deltaproteobacteria bacterium]
MAEINLTQTEADALIVMEKHRVDTNRYAFPMMGQKVSMPLLSADKREQFMLDIYRGQIDLLRGNYQNRARQVVVLVRLDFGGSPHRNPDDEEIPCPHLHLYREGYGDKWAMPIPVEHFSDINDRWDTLEDFMKYCNITQPPIIERGLFS